MGGREGKGMGGREAGREGKGKDGRAVLEGRGNSPQPSR